MGFHKWEVLRKRHFKAPLEIPEAYYKAEFFRFSQYVIQAHLLFGSLGAGAE